MKRFAIFSAFAAFSLSLLALDVQITPGQLKSLIPRLDPAAGSLYLYGKIDARDLGQLRNIPSHFRILDLRATEVVEYRGEVEEFPGIAVFPAGMIPDHVLFNSHFQTISLPPGITDMGKGICAQSPNLTTATVGSGTTEVSEYAFYGCQSLNSLIIPASVATVGTGAFSGCPQLVTVDLTSTAITSLPDNLFKGDEMLTTLRLPHALKSIGSEVFSGTSVQSLSLGSVTSLAPYALAGMASLTSVELNPDASYDSGTLMGDPKLKTVSGAPARIPSLFVANSPKTPADQLISNAQSIGSYAFAKANIDSISFSPSLTYVDKGAFAYTPGLEFIDARPLGSAVPDAHPEATAGIEPSGIVLMVSKENATQWKEHPVWSQFNVETGTTAVNELAGDTEIAISLAGNRLKVTSPEVIRSIQAWSADGRLLWQAFPETSEYESAITLAEGQQVVIIKTVTATQTRTITFLTR